MCAKGEETPDGESLGSPKHMSLYWLSAMLGPCESVVGWVGGILKTLLFDVGDETEAESQVAQYCLVSILSTGT